MENKIQYRLIKKFGPSIFHVKIPGDVITKLNNYVEKIVKDEKKCKDLDVGKNLVGDVTQEFVLEHEFINNSGWYSFLKFCVKQWIKLETNKEIKKFEIKNSWIVRQFQNEYNPTHWHGGHISGAGFLKVPRDMGKHSQKNKNLAYRGGNLQLIHGSRMFMCHSTLDLVPSVGDFYFFPNYLMHTVFPFKDTNDERRSISFNAVIDDEIYNVYGR